jgi:transposase-like protein
VFLNRRIAMSRGRKKRQRYTAAEKVAILKRHLIEREDVSAICDEIKLHTTVLYEWQSRFFENGVRAFESDEQQESKQLRVKVEALEAKLKRKDTVMSELVEELVAEKKRNGEL